MIRVVPANEATWEDLQRVLGTRGQGALCQRYRLRPGETFAGSPVEERAERLREQTNAGYPEAEATSGLVAYLDDEPVGWCAVGPHVADALEALTVLGSTSLQVAGVAGRAACVQADRPVN